MLQIVDLKNSTVPVHEAPYVGTNVLDKSAVPRPRVRYNGITMYMPAYTEKGPTGVIKLLDGGSTYNNLLDIYGEPNAKKYGLAYSAAVMHAQMGGSLAIQSVKAPSATHSAMIVTMTVKTVPGVPEALGWVYDAGANGEWLKFVDGVWYAKDTIIDGSTKYAVEMSNLFRGDTSASTEPFEDSAIPVVPNSENDHEATQAKINTAWANFKKRWKKVSVPALDIEFKSQPVDTYIANLTKKSNSAALTNLLGVNSWSTLQLMVSRLGSDESAQSIIDKIETNGLNGLKFEYTVPILWGMCLGKGKYGNDYDLIFSNSTGTIQGRPTLISQIYDRRQGVILEGSKKQVSFNNDYGFDRSPLLIDSAYSKPYFEGDFKFETAPISVFDEVGELIQAFMKKAFYHNENGKEELVFKEIGITPDRNGYSVNVIKAPLITNPINTGEVWTKGYGVKGQDLLEKMKKQIALLDESDDSSLHRMANIDFTRLDQLIGVVTTPGVLQYSFTGGHEGELRYMKEFDWDFNFMDAKLVEKYGNGKDPIFTRYQEKHGDTKIVAKMFADAFRGKTDNNVFNLYVNPADYIVDIGFPTSVKEAMFNLVHNDRQEIQLLMNVPIESLTIDEAVGYKNALNHMQNRNLFWFPGSFEWVDPASSRSLRVPTTFQLLPILMRHYVNGFDQPIAGTRNILDVNMYTGRGFGSGTLDEKDKLLESQVNILSVYENGQLYIDSQRSNYKLDEISTLREFHNNSILNRMMKTIYRTLQDYKHILATDTNVANIRTLVMEALQPYVNKVTSFNYNCEFKSQYDKQIGLLTHSIDVQFTKSIEYHHVNLTALPVE